MRDAPGRRACRPHGPERRGQGDGARLQDRPPSAARAAAAAPGGPHGLRLGHPAGIPPGGARRRLRGGVPVAVPPRGRRLREPRLGVRQPHGTAPWRRTPRCLGPGWRRPNGRGAHWSAPHRSAPQVPVPAVKALPERGDDAVPEPTLSVVVATIGRPTLGATIASIKAQRLIEGDEVLIAVDGPFPRAVEIARQAGPPFRWVQTTRRGYWGHGIRNWVFDHQGTDDATRLRGDLVAAMDDDNVFTPWAFDAIRRAAMARPAIPL
ncbi:MAG: glycosyltransferase family 2 protein, partial [Gemmatimonadetes bacterium]|nr:glycosyltransferase family 2 protein [Gemmatimonadota bacterium]